MHWEARVICNNTWLSPPPLCLLWLQIAYLAPDDQGELYQRLKFERGGYCCISMLETGVGQWAISGRTSAGGITLSSPTVCWAPHAWDIVCVCVCALFSLLVWSSLTLGAAESVAPSLKPNISSRKFNNDSRGPCDYSVKIGSNERFSANKLRDLFATDCTTMLVKARRCSWGLRAGRVLLTFTNCKTEGRFAS